MTAQLGVSVSVNLDQVCSGRDKRIHRFMEGVLQKLQKEDGLLFCWSMVIWHQVWNSTITRGRKRKSKTIKSTSVYTRCERSYSNNHGGKQEPKFQMCIATCVYMRRRIVSNSHFVTECLVMSRQWMVLGMAIKKLVLLNEFSESACLNHKHTFALARFRFSDKRFN